MRRLTRLQSNLLALCLLPLSHALSIGCQSARENSPASEIEKTTQIFPIRGTILLVDSGRGMILLDHEKVPGFSDAEAMDFELKDKRIVGELRPGEQITAKLLVRKDSDGNWDEPRLDQIVITGKI